MTLRNIFFLLGILFSILTLLGIGYVILSSGAKSAGYAVIPMIFAVIFLQLWRKCKNRNADEAR